MLKTKEKKNIRYTK